jgi:release factor glutamine methyltransferase
MNLNELKELFSTELKNLYSIEESQTILSYILEDAFEIPKLTIISQPQFEIHSKQLEKINSFLNDLKKGMPVQHLLGRAHFYGMILTVNPDVLIPRQETEELVDWIIKENAGAKLKILDVCTGSGCIALALKKHLPGCDITAIDVSEKALNVARKNAKDLNLEVQFKKVNALNLGQEMKNELFDIIVSNPPYIPSSDKDMVQRNVFMYEPHMALFVPDETPLIFYEAIGCYAKNLKPLTLYFEINEDLGDDLSELLDNMGFSDIAIRNDLNGKNRMLKCRYF